MSTNEITQEGSTGTQTTVREAVEGAEVLGDDADAGGRPDDCQCLAEYIDDDPLACWACYRESFETPNPNAGDDKQTSVLGDIEVVPAVWRRGSNEEK